jgi:hypothetical protein
MENKETNWTVGTTYWRWALTNSDIMVPLCVAIILDILTLIVFRSDFQDISLGGQILCLGLVNVGAVSMCIYSIFWWRNEKRKLGGKNG